MRPKISCPNICKRDSKGQLRNWATFFGWFLVTLNDHAFLVLSSPRTDQSRQDFSFPERILLDLAEDDEQQQRPSPGSLRRTTKDVAAAAATTRMVAGSQEDPSDAAGTSFDADRTPGHWRHRADPAAAASAGQVPGIRSRTGTLVLRADPACFRGISRTCPRQVPEGVGREHHQDEGRHRWVSWSLDFTLVEVWLALELAFARPLWKYFRSLLAT